MIRLILIQPSSNYVYPIQIRQGQRQRKERDMPGLQISRVAGIILRISQRKDVVSPH